MTNSPPYRGTYPEQPGSTPGWYTDPRVDRRRYWDGEVWWDLGPDMSVVVGTGTARAWVPAKVRDIDGIPLGPVAAFKSGFRNMFSVRGRASRSAYWWFWAMTYLALMVLGLVAVLLIVVPTMIDPDLESVMRDTGGGIVGLVMFLVAIPVWIAGLTVTGRRLHDTNLTAGYLWLLLVPYVGGLIILIMVLRAPQDPNDYTLPADGPSR